MPSAIPTEEEIQQGLVDLLQRRGFYTHHTRFSIGSDKHFPDIFAIRDGGIVAIECKGPRGRVAPGQIERIELFATVPGCLFAAVVGPSQTDLWISYDDALAAIAEI